jgi:hypothetical protein
MNIKLNDENQLVHLLNFISTGICSLIALKFLIYEFKQMWSSTKFSSYFEDLWNINDLSLCIFLFIYSAFSIGSYVELQSTAMKSVKCLIVITLFVKTIFYLRIFETFSFLVDMLLNVLKELKSFMIFFMIVIFAFSCLILVLLPESSADY